MTRGAAPGAMVYVNGHMFSSNYRDARIAYGVNDSGAIVGLRPTDTLTRAFLLDRHGFQDLGTLDGDPAGVSVAYAINASGVVVGYSQFAGVGQRAFAYSNGVMRDLGVVADRRASRRARRGTRSRSRSTQRETSSANPMEPRFSTATARWRI